MAGCHCGISLPLTLGGADRRNRHLAGRSQTVGCSSRFREPRADGGYNQGFRTGANPASIVESLQVYSRGTKPGPFMNINSCAERRNRFNYPNDGIRWTISIYTYTSQGRGDTQLFVPGR